ncbi:MAG: hypothetical protein ACEPOW_04450 [Bacteroidales bacterium]
MKKQNSITRSQNISERLKQLKRNYKKPELVEFNLQNALQDQCSDMASCWKEEEKKTMIWF